MEKKRINNPHFFIAELFGAKRPAIYVPHTTRMRIPQKHLGEGIYHNAYYVIKHVPKELKDFMFIIIPITEEEYETIRKLGGTVHINPVFLCEARELKKMIKKLRYGIDHSK